MAVLCMLCAVVGSIASVQSLLSQHTIAYPPLLLLKRPLSVCICPSPCAGCLPAGWSLRCGAALLGVGFVLPTCAVYFVEARARSRFAQLTAQRMAV